MNITVTGGVVYALKYCKIKEKYCVYTTEFGYCAFTACRVDTIKQIIKEK